MTWDELLSQMAACQVCEGHVPEPRPVFRLSTTASILVVGQAPGRRVHETGVPWNDPSGDRLRDWLGLDRDAFYDTGRIAILPMGLCYPGTEKGSDLPPRPECGPLWHPLVIERLTAVKLVLLVGAYAQRFYLGDRVKGSVTATVAAWRDYGPRFVPLVHPSPRNRGWLSRNPWFEAEVVAELRRRIAGVVG